MPKTKAWLLVIITSLLVYAPASSASGIDSEKAVEQPNNVKKQPSSIALEDYFVVDQESRTPEGSAYAACEIFERHGDVYTSTKRSIPASLVDQIKICALESEKFQTPNLKDVGVTPEALRAKVEALLKRGELPSSNPQKYPHPTFEQLDPKVRELYEFETVAKAASDKLPKPWNSGYMIVRFHVTADPPIILHSRHQANGMIPWGVIVGEKRWHTYSPQLPKLLAQFGKNGWLKAAGSVQRGPEWFDDFFFSYHHDYDRKDQIESIRDIEVARKISGWDKVASLVEIEDADAYNNGAIYIQVKMKDPNLAADRLRWTATKSDSHRDEPPLHDWNDFLRKSNELELAAQKAGWLKDWRLKVPGRSLVGMLTTYGNCTYAIGDETNRFWNKVGLSNKPDFYCKAYLGNVHTGDVFLGTPYKISLATDLGFGLTEKRRESKNMDCKPTLRAYDKGDEPLEKRMWCLRDQFGTRISASPPPKNYALWSGGEYPVPKEVKYDYSWPVDFEKDEDIEYLDTQLDEEPIQRVNPPFESTLDGEIDQTGKILLKPEFDWLGAFSNGLAPFRLPGGKVGYINESGKIVVAAQFDTADTFYEGLATVKRDGKCGFIDPTGRIQIPLNFDSVRRFSEGLAPAKRGTKFGYIDKTGKFVIEPSFGRARHFVNGLAHVQLDENHAYIDHSGKPIGGQWYDSLHRFSDDRAVFLRGDKYGYLDRSGHEIIPAKFTKAGDFRDGIANVMFDKTLSAVDKSGKTVSVPPSHSDFWDGPITEGLIRTRAESRSGCKFGFKNQSGKFVIQPIYDNVGVFNEGLCPAEVNRQWGVIDKSGSFVVKPTFEETGGKFSEHRLAIKKFGKWGVIDGSGKVIVEPKYDRIYSFLNGMAIVQSGVVFGYINSSGAEVIAPQFDSAHNFGSTGRARIGKRAEGSSPIDLP